MNVHTADTTTASLRIMRTGNCLFFSVSILAEAQYVAHTENVHSVSTKAVPVAVFGGLDKEGSK